MTKTRIILSAAFLLIGATHLIAQFKRAVPDVARPLPLAAVRLTGGPLKKAQDLNAAYLLRLEPDRMMAYYRERAGLKPKAKPYGGWDGGGKNLTGHIAGHYLSAVSMMFAATGDPRFKERVDYLVREMKEAQDKQGDGYLGALENGRERFAEVTAGNIRSSNFDLNGLWSPWYVLHKTYAGLRDAYRYAGNREALEIERKFAAWAETIMSQLNDAQTQKMLGTEFGGMNEILADLYADTGDERWLRLSHRFDHQAVFAPLARREDILEGLHANTQVPKLLGHLARYIYTGDEADGAAAKYFWEAVALRHSYATGGHGKDEYFGPPNQLAERVDARTDESCNVYNMLKMTRILFALNPAEKYAAFMERALFNHVLGSIDDTGQTCYMVPIGRGVKREYQNLERDFTCCVGSGMESHALHGEGIYYEAGNKLWVNFYTPSTLEWRPAGLKLTTGTDFPEGRNVTLKLNLRRPRRFTIALRRPAWAGEGFSLMVNGKRLANPAGAGQYVELQQLWRVGDEIKLVLPKTLRAEPLADNARRAAIMWGPLVLAGDLGPEKPGVMPETYPAFVSETDSLAKWLKPVPGKPGQFRATGNTFNPDGSRAALEFTPFYRLHHRVYGAYWDFYTDAEWQQQLAANVTAQERLRKLQAATISSVQPGDKQSEQSFNLQSEQSEAEREMARLGRRARKWFAYDLPVDTSNRLTLMATYHTEERAKRTFEILVDGVKIGEQIIERHRPGTVSGHFFDVEYMVPAEAITGKKKITVRFQATGGNEIGAVFGVRLIRAGTEK